MFFIFISPSACGMPGSPAKSYVRRARRLMLNAATVSLALSLGIVGPLACILHCTIFSAHPSASADSSPLARMICLLVGRERQAAPDHAMPKSSTQPPPALYQLARPLNQPALIVLVLALALLLAVRRRAPQMMIAPPTHPPRSAL